MRILRTLLWCGFTLGLLTCVVGAPLLGDDTSSTFLSLPPVVVFWIGVGLICGFFLIGLAVTGTDEGSESSDES